MNGENEDTAWQNSWVVVSYPLTLRVHWLVTTNPLIKYVYLECYLFQLMRCATQNRRPDWWQLHIFGIKDFICTSHLRSGVVMCLACGGVTGHAVLRLYFILSSSAVLSHALPLQTDKNMKISQSIIRYRDAEPVNHLRGANFSWHLIGQLHINNILCWVLWLFCSG